MEIWLLILIPVIAILLLLFKWHKRVAIWEYFLLFFIPLLIITCCYFGFKDLNTTAKEYWNSYILQANYFEDWNERVSCRHPIPCSHPKYCESRDDKGNVSTYQCGYKHWNDGYYHPYDVDYHPPRWDMGDNIGQSFSISQDYFNHLSRWWGNKTFQDLHRKYHTDDGDKYYTKYNRDFDKTIPIVSEHSYRNKVQASNSVYNFQKVSPTEVKNYGLFEHPKISNRELNPILGYVDKKSSDSLRFYNALYGSAKQIHMQILVFKNQPMSAAFMQEFYWKRGNKNEFTVCIGLKDSIITWAKVITWSEKYSLIVETESYIMSLNKLNMNKIVSYMGTEVVRKFERKKFKDFEYLTIQVPMWAILTSFFLVLASTIGISAFVLINEVDLE